jgi:hypothetical protein
VIYQRTEAVVAAVRFGRTGLMFGVSRRVLVRIRTVAAAGVLAAMAVAVAVALVTSTGSPTGGGTPARWTVTVEVARGGILAGGRKTIRFTVANGGLAKQRLATVTPAIEADPANGDAETSEGADIAGGGCPASWWAVVDDSSNPTLPVDLAPMQTYSGEVDVTLSTAAAQNALCLTASPGITFSVS